MDTRERPHGYFRQYLARMAPPPPSPAPLPLPATAPVLPLRSFVAPDSRGCKAVAHAARKSAALHRKTLVDAFKQHGMKLCDGTKLHAVAKNLTHLGVVPPTLGAHVASLYLSQNELRSLEGAEQFRALRLLSLGGNSLTRFSELKRLSTLQHLRQLNLSGNPLCELPNYRLRVIDMLPQLSVLDAREISTAERDAAALVASQDNALRELVLRQHVTILKLQRVVAWIQVLHEFRAVVVRSASSGRFDQLCSMPNDSLALDVDRFLLVWRDDDVCSLSERVELETQMLTIVARAQSTLATHPRAKAKALLLELAGHSAVRLHPSHTPSELRQQCAAWEDAYASVLQLQQETIVRLQSQCERHNRAMCDALRELLVLEPHERRATRCWPRVEIVTRSRSSPRAASANRALPSSPTVVAQTPEREIESDYSPPAPVEQHQLHQQYRELARQQTPSTGTQRRSAPQQLRCGEFGGSKTLHEAVEAFTLRSSGPSQRSTRKTAKTSTALAPPPPPPPVRRVELASALRQSSVNTKRSSVEVPRVLEYKQLAHHSALPPRERVDEDRDEDDDEVTSLSETRDLESETVASVNTHYAPSLASWPATTPHSRSRGAAPSRDWPSQHPQATDDAPAHESSDDRSELKRRQQELEDREERYLKALMASEQRELELRQQLQTVELQLSEYRASMAQDDAERRRIKHEVASRVAAIAAPTICRRFFARWRRVHAVSRELQQRERRHSQRVLHDAFWTWRRCVWRTQHVRGLVRRRALLRQRQHFVEWLNVTRICVIARHSQALREAQLLQRVLREWQRLVQFRRHHALVVEHALQAPESRQRRRVLVATLRAWRLHVRRHRVLERQQRRHERQALVAWTRLVLSHWRAYVAIVARPRRQRIASWISSRRRLESARCLTAWRRLAGARRLHARHVLRRRWTTWRQFVRQRHTSDAESLTLRLQSLRRHLVAWRETASRRSRSRRAGTVVRRVVTHRRLRKLWMHWKLYALARRRYVQGATKAVRHYWRKLLRRLWTQWCARARAHAASRREHSRNELARHFHALQVAVSSSKSARRQELLVSQLQQRRARRRLRLSLVEWRRHSRDERQRRVQLERLGRRVRLRELRVVWSQWKTLRWREALATWRERYRSASAAHAALEHALNDRDDSTGKLRQSLAHARREIASQREELEQRRRQQDEDVELVRHLEQRCRDGSEREQQQAMKLAELQQQRDDDRARWSLLETERQHEMQSVVQRLQETQAALETTRRQTEEMAERERRLEDELSKQRRAAEDADKRWEARVAALQQSLDDAERRLSDARREREDTANRLQDYERRLATTCVEMQAHERAVEDEVALLRTENARLAAHRRDADARSGELERLLHEKNAQIVELTMRLEQIERREKERERERELAREEIVETTVAASPAKESTAMQTDDMARTETMRLLPSSERQESESSRALVALATLPPSAEEQRLEEHTSRLHADLRLLQQRITQRLALAPCVPSLPDVLASRRRQFPALCLSPSQDSSVDEDDDEKTKKERLAKDSDSYSDHRRKRLA
ncbi:hypothetical protein PINS_up000489 [Pythium insidiosum]|nr:hypothetical protein PINS_up000489 [Pythium insidiosum]